MSNDSNKTRPTTKINAADLPEGVRIARFRDGEVLALGHDVARCISCRAIMSLANFPKDNGRSRGHGSRCHTCNVKSSIESQRRKKEREALIEDLVALAKKSPRHVELLRTAAARLEAESEADEAAAA